MLLWIPGSGVEIVLDHLAWTVGMPHDGTITADLSPPAWATVLRHERTLVCSDACGAQHLKLPSCA